MGNKTINEDTAYEDVVDEINNGIKLDLLSPSDKKDDPRVKRYLKHINDAISNPDVRNLALTGVYGSGKSTIIKSYKSKYPNKKTLNISLASFNETDKYESFKDQIQLTILQQIIYSQDSVKLPDSRINRIREIDVWKKGHLLKVFGLLVFIISTYLILNFFSYQLNPNNWSNASSFNNWSILFFLLFIGSSFFIGQFLLKMMSNSKINKINVKGEAELGNKVEHKDFLNKYIDEILYFFEKIQTDIVVIEDLDRFNSTEIYRTLRELNFILNNYLENTMNSFKKVTFLYAIKDDIFLNELDRTKFFDLIIPTIPFVNFSNSKNVLTKKLEEIYGNEEDLFNNPNSNKDFINTVSAFITDNRILVNIINEFVVYKEQQKLQKEEFNQEKLLALIIYKNLRPKDFSRLHKGSSNIDVVFANKNKLVKKSVKDFNNEILEINESITEIRQSHLISIANLNTIFLYHIKEVINNQSAKGLIVNTKKIKFNNIIIEGIDLNIFYSEEIFWFSRQNMNNATHTTLDIIDKLVGYKYSERYNIIVNEDKLINEKENKIETLRQNLRDVQNETLAQILIKKDLSKDKLKEEFGSFYLESEINEEKERIYNDLLLIFLLENGYIDEHYRVYISTFQKGGLTESDQEFKINIISRVNEPKHFDYKLSNIDDLVNDLPINYFKDNRILNTNLIDFLVVHREFYVNKFETTLKTISIWSKRSKQFFIIYINQGVQNVLFIDQLAKSWKDMWNTIQSDSSFLHKDKNRLLHLLLVNTDSKTLIALNNKGALSNDISDDLDFFYNFSLESKTEDILKES